ncbi:hypothetical protein G7076_01925 [Sphingomonas sp. HDW15A]|uniref:hypothetical protein n=1 Tax=Sphingomonas sp. HDW15A TaxID=2714942 RepID=UPI00140AC928|nr:hypothetical protein [Sphingomonas sp. HDW15A]QIK95408.1 hypothetical protein G7076_01925 [Sphingomonas sp. HDW15A]
MISALMKVLTLFALMLMPLGMTGAIAGTGPTPDDHSALGMTAGHCDKLPVKDKAPAAKMDCTTTCTALPAAEVWVPLSIMKPTAPRTVAISAPFSGIEPEIATPPPRRS